MSPRPSDVPPLSPHAQALLRQAQGFLDARAGAELPVDAEFSARLLARVNTTLGAAAPMAASTTLTSAPALMVTPKLFVVLLAASAAVGGVAGWGQLAHEPAAPPAPVMETRARATRPAHPPLEPPPAVPAQAALQPEKPPAPKEETALTLQPPPAARATVASKPPAARTAVAPPSALREAPVEPQGPTPPDTPAPSAAHAQTVVPTVVKPAEPQPPLKVADELQRDSPEERLVLERARSQLAQGHAAAALTTLEQHHARFPEGRLTEERQALRVTAWLAVDQPEHARTALQALARDFPHSPLLPGLRDAVIQASTPR